VDSKPRQTSPENNANWVQLGAVEDLPDEGGLFVRHQQHAYAIFGNESGEVWVLDDACPHAGASLSAGHLSDGCAVCPWHSWGFELATGQCPDNRAIAVKRYDAKILDGKIWACLDDAK
jgi:nitrite reductase (NADH) small subunit